MKVKRPSRYVYHRPGRTISLRPDGRLRYPMHKGFRRLRARGEK